MLTDLFLNIINMSLTASVLVVLVLLIRKLMSKFPKAYSYLLWFVVLFRLLCPVSFESEISIIPDKIANGTALEHVSNLNIGEHQIYWNDSPEYKEAIEHGIVPSIVEDDNQASAYVSIKTADSMCEPTLRQVLMPALSYIWIAGMVGMVMYHIASYIRLKRRLIGAVPYDLEEDIYFSDYIETAFVIGFAYPRIYLPSCLKGEELHYILMHEREHIRRKDHIMKTIFLIALCVHWFNPLIWIMFGQLCKDMEMSCDEAVMKKLDQISRNDYAESLLNMAVEQSFLYGITIAFGERDIKSRIKNVLQWKKPKVLIVVAAFLVSVGVSILFLLNPVDHRVKHPYEWSRNLKMDDISAYSVSNWSEEDVYYYVSNTEIANVVYVLNEMKENDYEVGNALEDCEITVNLTCGTDVFKLTYGNGTTMFSFEDGMKLEGGVWQTENKQLTSVMEKIISDATSVSKEIPEKNLAPTKEQVLAMREMVLEGMTQKEKSSLTELIKAENLQKEYRYLKDNQFWNLKKSDSPYWRIFSESGTIILYYAFDANTPVYTPDSGMTEEEYNITYGTPVVYELDTPLSEEFCLFLEEVEQLLASDILDGDLEQMREYMRLATETHDVEYLYQIFYKLHDLDYFLFRYGPEDVGEYVWDDSFVTLFYDSLLVYEEHLPKVVEAFHQEPESYYRMSDGSWRVGFETYAYRVEFNENGNYYAVLSKYKDVTLQDALSKKEGTKVVFSIEK